MRDASVYMSVRHPEWGTDEMEFVLTQAKSGLDRILAEDGRRLDAVCEPELVDYEARLQDPTARDAAILELIDKVGPEVLWDAGPGPSGPLVQALIRERVRAAYAAARSAICVGEREAAAKFLGNIGKALAGDRRGRRERIVVDTFAVRRAYNRRLFRLRRAFALLTEWPWSMSREDKVRAVAKACGLPGTAFVDLVLDQQGSPRNPVTAEEAARIWTASRFGITQQTVFNTLAPSALRVSRK